MASGEELDKVLSAFPGFASKAPRRLDLLQARPERERSPLLARRQLRQLAVEHQRKIEAGGGWQKVVKAQIEQAIEKLGPNAEPERTRLQTVLDEIERLGGVCAITGPQVFTED